jgi:hypothetical protein
MDTKDLESAVRKLIEDIYEAKYNRLLTVKETFNWAGKHLGYKLSLSLNKDERPIELAMEGNEEQFLKFIENELRHNCYNHVKFYTAKRIYFSHGCCEK